MKKKIVILMAGILWMQSVLSGCGSSVSRDANGVIYNNVYNEEKLVTANGMEVIVSEHEEDLSLYKTTGFGVVEPKSWNNIVNAEGAFFYPLDPEALYYCYLPKEQVDILNAIDENTPEEEMYELYGTAFDLLDNVFCIFRVNEEDQDTIDNAEYYKDGFEYVETLATVGKDTYYFAYNTDVPQEGYSEEDQKDIQILIDSFDTLKNNLIFFPPANPMDDFKVDLSEFTAKDLDGNEVTEEIWKDYDVTMVNVWATWCKYCVHEMPQIEELYQGLPDNVNIITICSDAADERETALEELEQAGVTFTTLEGNEELEEKVMEYITAFPTTFFVDKNGKVVGQLQVGAPGGEGEIVEGYRALIEDALGNK